MNKKRNRAIILFVLAAIITTAAFITGLKHASFPTYAYTFNSEGPTETKDLYGDMTAEGDITFLGDICGISLGSFNCNGAFGGGSDMVFTITDKKTGEQVLTYGYPMWTHQFDDGRVFIPIEYHADEETTWHVELNLEGITEDHVITVSLTDGELYAASVHRDIATDYSKVIVCYVISLMILGFAAYLYFVRKLPLTNGEPDTPPQITRPKPKLIIAVLIAINIVLTVVFTLVYADSRRYVDAYPDKAGVISLLLTLLVISGILVNALYLINAIRPIGIAKNYLIAALTLGFVMSILIPNICVPDERYHMNNCYAMSNTIMGVEDIENPSRIRKRVTEVDSVDAATAEITNYKYSAIQNGLFKKADNTDYVAAYGNTSRVTNAPVICYLPGAIGISIARLLGLNGVTAMLFARWATLITVTLAIFIAIRKMPVGKAAMACAALIPMSLQEIASTSYDGFIIAAAFIFTAYSLFLILRPDRRNVLDWAVTIASAVVLSLCKGGVYIPLIGLIVLIEFSFESKQKGRLRKAGILLCLALPVILASIVKLIPVITKTMNSNASHSGMVGGLTDLYTAGYALEHKEELVSLLARTLSAKGEVYLQGFIGGRMGLSVYVPSVVMAAFIVIMLLAATRGDPLGKELSRGARIYLAALIAIGFMLIMASMLFASTVKSSPVIMGVQGRYFIPFLALMLILTRSKRLVFKRENDNNFIIAMAMTEFIQIAFVICSVLSLEWFFW